jgi:hypothetical protein
MLVDCFGKYVELILLIEVSAMPAAAAWLLNACSIPQVLRLAAAPLA